MLIKIFGEYQSKHEQHFGGKNPNSITFQKRNQYIIKKIEL